MSLTDTTKLEKASLEAHVDLCAMRYSQLNDRLTSLEGKVTEIQQDINDGQKSIKTTIITSASTIAVALLGIIGTMLMKF